MDVNLNINNNAPKSGDVRSRQKARSSKKKDSLVADLNLAGSSKKSSVQVRIQQRDFEQNQSDLHENRQNIRRMQGSIVANQIASDAMDDLASVYEELNADNADVDALNAQLSSIFENAQFNDRKLLDGSFEDADGNRLGNYDPETMDLSGSDRSGKLEQLLDQVANDQKYLENASSHAEEQLLAFQVKSSNISAAALASGAPEEAGAFAKALADQVLNHFDVSVPAQTNFMKDESVSLVKE